MARAPYKKPSELKNTSVTFRVSKEQRQSIEALAEHHDMSVSELMLHIIHKELKQKGLNQ